MSSRAFETNMRQRSKFHKKKKKSNISSASLGTKSYRISSLSACSLLFSLNKLAISMRYAEGKIHTVTTIHRKKRTVFSVRSLIIRCVSLIISSTSFGEACETVIFPFPFRIAIFYLDIGSHTRKK